MFKTMYFLMIIIYAITIMHKIFPNILVLATSKKKITYEKIADLIVEKNKERGRNILKKEELSADFELAFSAFETKLQIQKPLAGCLYHYSMDNLKKIKKFYLIGIYLSNHQFRFELKLYFFCNFLPLNEIENYLQQQKIKLYSTFDQLAVRKKHCLQALLKSFHYTWFKLIKANKWNMWTRINYKMIQQRF